MKNKYELNFYPPYNVKGMQLHFKKMAHKGWHIQQIHSLYFQYGKDESNPVFCNSYKTYVAFYLFVFLGMGLCVVFSLRHMKYFSDILFISCLLSEILLMIYSFCQIILYCYWIHYKKSSPDAKSDFIIFPYLLCISICILSVGLLYSISSEFTIVFVNGALGIWMFTFFINGIRMLCSQNVSKILICNYVLKFLTAILITFLISQAFKQIY